MSNPKSIDVLEQPRRISYHTLRPTHVSVDLDQLVRNYRQIKTHCGCDVMPVIKADAYGHGIVAVAERLEQEGCAYFGVAYLEEALLLREEGIQTPILVMGGILGEQIPLYIEHNITLTASSIDKLNAIEQTAQRLQKRPKVHLKIDTGMGRIGVQEWSAHKLLDVAKGCHNITLEGIFSHLANADTTELEHAKVQLQRFEGVLQTAEDIGVNIPMVHIANSGAALQLKQSHKQIVRTGLLLYGVYPDSSIPKSIAVKPVLRWTSKVVYFKVLPPNRPIGYGSKWSSPKQTRIVTIPVGYGDGYHRRMTGRAEVLIRGKRYPVVGSICMDQIMVDIGWDEVFNGEEVVLLGSQGEEAITVDELAEWADTISYEIMTSINLRVTRRYNTAH